MLDTLSKLSLAPLIIASSTTAYAAAENGPATKVGLAVMTKGIQIGFSSIALRGRYTV
jgi:hypothetical protein